MFYFFEQTNELLVLKQWKAAFYRSISPHLGCLRKKISRAMRSVLIFKNTSKLRCFPIHNGSRTEWSPIRSVIIRVKNSIVRFV